MFLRTTISAHVRTVNYGHGFVHRSIDNLRNFLFKRPRAVIARQDPHSRPENSNEGTKVELSLGLIVSSVEHVAPKQRGTETGALKIRMKGK